MINFFFLPHIFWKKICFSENFSTKRLFGLHPFLRKKKIMNNINKISVFSFFLYSAAVLLTPFPAAALGEKAVRDASYYVHDLDDVHQVVKEKEKARPNQIFAKCGNFGSEAKGIIVNEDGNFFGYQGIQNLRQLTRSNINFLKEDKESAKKLMDYARKINLESISFDSFQRETEYCSLEYFKNNSLYTTRWSKHPYLREFNPPPQELLVLFEAVQDAASGKAPVFTVQKTPGYSAGQAVPENNPESKP